VESSMAAKRIRWTLNRSVLSIVYEGSSDEDAVWWYKRTPNERFQHMEYLRQINYGYDPVTSRLQRVLEIVERRPR
ncbi:MAG: hypothetical protein PHG96_03685, partial [Kiritimatiellae bacterium]|nr:hypothetical protein [Kiritimatiellia bacterium]